jgi:hypothetical protein
MPLPPAPGKTEEPQPPFSQCSANVLLARFESTIEARRARARSAQHPHARASHQGTSCAEFRRSPRPRVHAISPPFDHRLALSRLQVAMSKIFCAGAGWQLFSILASTAGFSSDSIAFYLLTGLGDALGVALGHLTFRAFSRFGLCRTDVDMRAEALVALWLGSSATFSGTAWQYVVNVVSASQPFWPTLVWTGCLCGFAFFCGLRLFRIAYAPLGLELATYANFGSDRLLAASVGAGTALFVATDPSHGIPWLAFIAVQPEDSAALGVCKAGLSTFIGFVVLQSAQNLLLPVGANWLDGSNDDDDGSGADEQEAALDRFEREKGDDHALFGRFKPASAAEQYRRDSSVGRDGIMV